MEKIKNKSESFPYEMGLLSYVPWVGVIFGIVSIIWGQLTRSTSSKVPSLLGLGGIVVNLILGGIVYYGIHYMKVTSMFHFSDTSFQILIRFISEDVFLLMVIIASVTFTISFLAFMLKRRLLYFKGALFGLMMWASLLYITRLDEYGFFEIGVPSGESGLVFMGLILMVAPGFVIAGLIVAHQIKKRLIDSQP